MTRFARSRGSKADNARLPEAATPWSQLRAGLGPPTRAHSTPQTKLRLPNPEDEDHDPTDPSSSPFEAPAPATDLERVPADIEVDSDEDPTARPDLSAVAGDSIPTPTPSKKRVRAQDKCLQCKVKGHRKMDCPTLTEERRRELRELTQMKIERKGHGTGRKKNKKKDKEAPPTPATPSASRPSTQPASLKKDKAGQLVQAGEGLFQGFRVKKEDEARLRQLRDTLQSGGAQPDEVRAALKRERRNAEKELAKSKKMVCYNCRQPGHLLSECPQSQLSHQTVKDQVGQCFKCGSNEHTAKECQSKRKGGEAYAFAVCFVCQETGHLAKACPDNPRGMYPKGGGCRFCGSVEHLKSECPRKAQKDDRDEVRVDRVDGSNIEDEPVLKRPRYDKLALGSVKKAQKVVSF
ncbi:hypothetical protein TCAL_04756 [Tigriopus californicus]|uniref:CCHC-type domain-containing protein n=1 Tax=Tigriopus californicus TaxID=6832 RepID=A0A553P1Z5_TIGCA|nr:DNA-binding protein HEXBP-like [Tigriopus californicus]TRY71706.1 hypothetical protein TCAL_04756 [Tigriopus californicus]|eukprot:TCALIF_04756-PA protein Name:"Similar to ZCCHC9 Zinc finger CCHC domain-containing protein 9 (Homo sapiens)" AED:0.02 eAED:0.09 QI:0/-1/0/1/-1/1/1/0/406